MRQIKNITVKTRRYKMLDETSRVLVQQVGDGSIIKRFEKTSFPTKDIDIVCPHFLELKWAYGCPFNCAWCYLKGTLRLLPTKTKPVIKNLKKIKEHLQAFFRCAREKEILNSGELADSLMFENNTTPFSKFIIPLFESQSEHRILFLTKSNMIGNLLSIEKHSNALISFSLNPKPVSERWERGPPVKERIEAATKLREADYVVRIRIDPIIPISDWQSHYKNLIDDVFEKFTPERITLGTLRGLQSTINEAKDKSWVKYLSENSNWGKKINTDLRYLIYSTLINYLRSKHNYTAVGLCKETKKMWRMLHLNYNNIKCNCVW